MPRTPLQPGPVDDGRPCAADRRGGWGTPSTPCPHTECAKTVRGPVPLCEYHARDLRPPYDRPTAARLQRMVEEATRSVPPDITETLLAGWTPRQLWHAWRWWKWDDSRPAIPLAVKTAVYKRDGHVCRLCGATERLSLDHIQPWSLGGQHTVENLRVLCIFCNVRRGAPEDWQDDLTA